mgnify:CR=1 FL=1
MKWNNLSLYLFAAAVKLKNEFRNLLLQQVMIQNDQSQRKGGYLLSLSYILCFVYFQLNDSQESVPQDAESGLISSTPPVDDSEPVSHPEEQGAVGGVKIVLYQHPLRYNREGACTSAQYLSTEFNSDNDSYSTPVAECHVECTSHALVEHNIDNNTDSESDQLVERSSRLARSESVNSVHSATSDDDLSGERHSLITHLPTSRDDNSSQPTDSLMG